MNRFIRDQNIANYFERLHTEEDGQTRVTLQRLLVEEERRFGEAEEQIEQLDRLISRCQRHISTIEGHQASIGSSPLSDRLLKNSHDLVFFLETLRGDATLKRENSFF